MSEDLDKLRRIFRDVFDRPDLVIEPASNSQTVEGWDSLMHINLVSSIEQEYGIQFSLGELEQLKTVGEMLDLICKKVEAARK